jgi:anti-sigma-K factor RskA
MNIANNPELVSRLAAEYVLGTLRGGARRRFAQMMKKDATLRNVVSAWEQHLTPLAERIPALNPPKRVWSNIESRISGTPARVALQNAQAPSKASETGGFWRSLAFWRGLGFATTSLAAVLLTLTLRTNPVAPTTEPMMMAVLEDQGEARMIVEQPKSGYLMVKMVKPWVGGEDKSMELWVIPKDGAPRSLGLLNDTGDTKLAKPDMDIRLTDGAVFALSKEPRGGSPTGAPTGMVLCKGVIARMPTKNNPARQGQI